MKSSVQFSVSFVTGLAVALSIYAAYYYTNMRMHAQKSPECDDKKLTIGNHCLSTSPQEDIYFAGCGGFF